MSAPVTAAWLSTGRVKTVRVGTIWCVCCRNPFKKQIPFRFKWVGYESVTRLHPYSTTTIHGAFTVNGKVKVQAPKGCDVTILYTLEP